MQCNIDTRGRTVRLVIGALCLAAGALLLGGWSAGWFGGGTWMLATGIGSLAGGAFALFEGAAGWCALRALGIRTRI